MSSPDITIEAVRSWLNTGFLGFIAICVAKIMPQVISYLIRSRELRMQERKDEREGYGPLIEALQQDAQSLRTEVGRLGGLLAFCQEAHAASDAKIAELEAYIRGSERAAIARSAHTMVELPSTPEHIKDVAAKTLRAMDGEE